MLADTVEAGSSGTRPAATSISRLGLGCVQLGQDYGAARPTSRPPDEDAGALLARASALGIRFLDTAPAYGDSEQRIGALAPREADFAVVTKLDWKVGPDASSSLDGSLAVLRLERCFGLLAHSAQQLLDASEGGARWKQLERLRGEGRVERIGASVYTPDEALELLRRFPSIDLMQLPLSVLDTRFANSGALAELHAAGVVVHARSALLQGALLLDEAALPGALRGLAEPLAAFRARATALGLTPLEAALGFVAAHHEVAVVLVGASCAAELEACAAAFSCLVDPGDFGACAATRPGLEDLVDPRTWTRAAS